LIYVIYFADLGTPKTGLSPTIDIFIKVSDGGSAGSAPSISELSGGFYKFTYAPTEDIAIRVDSNDVNMADRDKYIVLIASPDDEGLAKILQVDKGRWKIQNNQMIFYKEDGVTPLYTFNLKDESGQPSEKNVYERVPV